MIEFIPHLDIAYATADLLVHPSNGIGYMGSTIFALPGIKGLIPCGKTEKGLLSNKSFTTNRILMTTNNDLTDGQNIILMLP